MLDSAKAVIVPSEWYENCPYSVIEAMARSRIIIASRIAGLPELVDDGKTGYLIEPHNIDDLSEKIRMVDNLTQEDFTGMCISTYERAKSLFDSEKYYQKIISIYQRLIKDNNR